MKYSQEKEGEKLIVSIAGHFDPEKDDEFQSRVDNAIVGGESKIVLNMKGISSINSQGLSVLINARKKANIFGGDIKLSELKPYVEELFELTCLHKVFEIYPTNAEALTAFK